MQFVNMIFSANTRLLQAMCDIFDIENDQMNLASAWKGFVEALSRHRDMKDARG
jgi:hypothetical protein